jgi:phospholipase C
MVPMDRETRLADRCVRRCLLIGGTAAIDRWGPGTRVPTIIISPFAKRHFIDHTTYDTTSILKLIETRWALAPLGDRDAHTAGLTYALQLQ